MPKCGITTVTGNAPMYLKSQLDNYRLMLRASLCLNFGLIAMLLVAIWGVVQVSEARRIWLPPDLRAGAVIDGQTIPKATVYTFAFAIFQQLNRWRENGETEYDANIQTLQDYFTPQCRTWLRQDRQRRRAGHDENGINELRDRTRSLSLPPEVIYHSERVQLNDEQGWTVQLELDLQETFNGETVKQARMVYPLRVVRYAVDWERNPWGLAIDCFAQPGPTRLWNGLKLAEHAS